MITGFHHRVYVGLNGDIFTKWELIDPSGYVVYNPIWVTHLDKANFDKEGRRSVWTFEGDTLILIAGQVEGFLVHTFAVDPARSSCTYTLTIQPEPATGRMVVPTSPPGKTLEVISYTVRSSSCTMTRQNILANDH